MNNKDVDLFSFAGLWVLFLLLLMSSCGQAPSPPTYPNVYVDVNTLPECPRHMHKHKKLFNCLKADNGDKLCVRKPGGQLCLKRAKK